MAYELTTALKTDSAGQTLTAQLVDKTGGNVGAAITTGFHDRGGGFYLWTYAGFPSDFRGIVEFRSGLTLKTIVAINPQEGEYLDAHISAIVSSARIAVSTPVAQDLRITLVRGDDYKIADGRQLRWLAVGWPDLTGAAIAFTARKGSNTISAAGSVITPTGDQEVAVELSASDTADLQVGAYRYDVEATLASGRVVTLVLSALTILEDQTI